MKPFRDFAALTGHGRTDLRADALAIAADALAAVDPVAALRDLVRLEGDRLVVRGRPWSRPPERPSRRVAATVTGRRGGRRSPRGRDRRSPSPAAASSCSAPARRRSAWPHTSTSSSASASPRAASW